MDLFDRPARVLLAISRAFDFQADWLPANLRYIGPLLDQPSWSEPWRAPWSTDRPRVLIAGSTGAQGQGELIQKIIYANGMDRPRSRSPTVARVRGGLSGEGRPPWPARPSFIQ
jgi:hypothetical protein